MIKIDVLFSPLLVDELSLRNKNIIIIDVLRASTTIATALYNGAKEVIPVASVESAVKVSGNLFGGAVIRGGERNGKIIEGFNLGNSPLEYTVEAVKGKSIIFCTTNGSPAMVKARYAKNMVIGSFVNMSKVVQFIRDAQEDVVIICAGKQSAFCMEDAVCAGMMIKNITDETEIQLNDSAVAAQTLYQTSAKSLLKMIKNCNHGQQLTEIGFQGDLKFCAAIDTIPVLPQLIGNVIKLKKDELKITLDFNAENPNAIVNQQ